MIFNLNLDALKLDASAVEKIKNELGKINMYIPDFPGDLQINLLIKKTHSKFHPLSKQKKHASYSETKLKLSNFEGWIKMALPRKVLYTTFQGLTVKGAIGLGTRNLINEIKKYKTLHFKSQSKYPHHETIRKDYG